MKNTIKNIVLKSLTKLKILEKISEFNSDDVKIEYTKNKNHGDLTTNIAFVLSKYSNFTARNIARFIVELIPKNTILDHVEISESGFINFFICNKQKLNIIYNILKYEEKFGNINIGKKKKVLIEFVSANPTGPLHVGHGRSAAFGIVVSNLLRNIGYSVYCEYYINDIGRQIEILTISVWLQYLNIFNSNIILPNSCYNGSYIILIANYIIKHHGKKFFCSYEKIQDIISNNHQYLNAEIYIDKLTECIKALIGMRNFNIIKEISLNYILCDIKEDLSEFGIQYDYWFSEKKLLTSGCIIKCIDKLKKLGHTYIQNGALWFNAKKFGDEKDRVLIKQNGSTTYFASDIAYHIQKYDRGFDKIINIFGSDHHGYVNRIKSVIKIFGYDENILDIILVQFSILYRGGNRVQMSTRSGSFVTLRELRKEIGNDSTKFFYIMKKPDQHMDFDLDLAKSECNNNPIYYIQYAYARISSVFKELKNRNIIFEENIGLLNLKLLSTPEELYIVNLLNQYCEIIISSAKLYTPHKLAYYLYELATSLHKYYNSILLLCRHKELRNARLCLIKSIKQILYNGLKLLGISAIEHM